MRDALKFLIVMDHVELISFDENLFDVSSSEFGYHVISCRPYMTSRKLNCKERWRKRRLVEVFQTEFALSPTYVSDACIRGDILLNEGSCRPESILNNGDVVSHSWLAREPAVSTDGGHGSLPHIVWRKPGVVGVFKPHGLPTVAQGKYFHTNLVSLVKFHLQLDWVQPVNRLDKAVAGLVVFSLSPEVEIRVERKVYVAKLDRDFPWDTVTCSARLRLLKHVPNQVLRTTVDEEHGIDCVTEFRRLSSRQFVECRPLTGRTHQIRAHLSHLGFPIVGDSTYAGEVAETSFPAQQQPSSISLFSHCYRIKVNGGLSYDVQCSKLQSLPSWLPSSLLV